MAPQTLPEHWINKMLRDWREGSLTGRVEAWPKHDREGAEVWGIQPQIWIKTRSQSVSVLTNCHVRMCRVSTDITAVYSSHRVWNMTPSQGWVWCCCMLKKGNRDLFPSLYRSTITFILYTFTQSKGSKTQIKDTQNTNTKYIQIYSLHSIMWFSPRSYSFIQIISQCIVTATHQNIYCDKNFMQYRTFPNIKVYLVFELLK